MPSQRCGAKTRTGGECTQWAVTGAKRCRMHGGRTEKARVRAQAQRAMKALGDVPTENVDPAEALLRLVTQKAAEVGWLRQRVIEVAETSTPAGSGALVEDDHGDADENLTWGTTKQTTGFDPESGMVSSTVREAAPNVWWRLLREAEDQLAKYSTAALRAGVERRQLELQETQALHLAGAINRILDALELTAEQSRRVPEVVPEVLRTLPVAPEHTAK